VVLVAAALNVAMPVDPGAHIVEVSAKGRQTQTTSVQLAEAQVKIIDVAPGPADGSAPPASEPVSHAPAAPPSGMGVLFWSGVGVAGAGTILGIAFGAVAVSKGSALASACPDHDCTSTTGQSDYNAAKSMSLASDIGFAFAGAGAVVAVVGYFTHRHAKAERPGASLWIGPGSGGVKGTF
jgi:hypothetical protein